MAISQPASSDNLNSPDHSLMHRQIATDPSAPVSSVTVNSDGVTTLTSLIATTADINAGTVDAVIGGNTPADGSFTTLSTSAQASPNTLEIGGSGAIVTTIENSDALGTSDTKLCTQGNVKAYVDNAFSVLDAYPVGAIYISVVATSPATLFGGTWSAFGTGRVLVGIDSGDYNFNTVEETGGEKTHTLTGGESGTSAHSHSITTSLNEINGNAYCASGTDNSYTASTETSSEANADDAHNNVQPYIVVHMWKRTA